MPTTYSGRFAPSPTGPLHAGSLVAALASWLDARAHGGRWLVRIEDTDTPRCVPGADQIILQQLAGVGLVADEAPVYQSQRHALYQAALEQLVAGQLAFPCACTRQDIAQAQALAAHGRVRERHEERVYPGTCRHGLQGREARAWRFLTGFSPSKMPEAQYWRAPPATDLIADETAHVTHWHDRRLGAQSQDVAREVGDFILKRADGLWAYQLAVVVDDAAQGITHVVRGEDLADNTARQILLQGALGALTPAYLHVPLVRGANGEKLSKQNEAMPLDTREPLSCLRAAGEVLQLRSAQAETTTPSDWLAQAVTEWRTQWATPGHTAPTVASANTVRDMS